MELCAKEATCLEYLGISLDTVKGIAFISLERQAKLRNKVQAFLNDYQFMEFIPRMSMARILGSLNWFAPFYAEAPRLMPPSWQSLYALQGHLSLSQAWSNSAHIRFTQAALHALKQWNNVLLSPPSRKVFLFSQSKGFWSGTSATKPFVLPGSFDPAKHMFIPTEIHPHSRIAVLYSDACTASYGGCSGEERYSGRFSEEDLPHHINYKELLAVYFDC